MKDRFDGLVEHLLESGFFLQQAIEVLEKCMIQNALDRNKGNQCAASKLLGIHRNTLQRKMVDTPLTAPAPDETQAHGAPPPTRQTENR